MNINKLKTLIAIMTRVETEQRAFNINLWQQMAITDDDGYKPHRTEQEVSDCGTSCCVAGWLGVSPEFIAEGGDVTNSGSPRMVNATVYETGAGAMAVFLESNEAIANQICGFEWHENENCYYFPETNTFYFGTHTTDITPTTVVKRLTELLAEYEV
ncbi:hypothetical protein [Methylotenera sp.]|uniref:hypothetical protein n=1 Tax=Methylotenera sp. TaxID=2051956 RepID=UPI002487CFCB|nr:hypothetical protein [Methylotenera sp.]MDI1362545.1 hypothetical protein [Methylotenera sp.]